MMDESCSRELHRLLSFFRLLTDLHPRAGAQLYALHVFGLTELKPGWNAVHAEEEADRVVRYMWIGTDGGRTTLKKPDVPESEIHHVHEGQIPEFEGSPARQAMMTIAEDVVQLNLPGFDAAWIRATVEQIDATSRQPLRGPAPSVDARIQRELSRLRRLIANNVSVPQLTEPLCDVIRDFLSFRLTRTHAANILSVLLCHYLKLPSPLDNSPLADRLVANVDHLIERVVALKNDRSRWTLSSFYDATCLALLLGDTALIVCRQLASRPQVHAEQRHFADRRGLFIDELMAHELAPCLIAPIDLAPITPAETHHAQMIGIVDPASVYTGAGIEKGGPVDFTTIWPKVAAFSQRAEVVDIVTSITDRNHPMSLAERQRLMMFLITMELGRVQKPG